MNPGSPLRVSVRPDFDMIEVTTDGPARTKDGRPWTRWAKYGSYAGWHAVGARKPKLSGQPKFWEAVFSVACAVAGGNLDQVHCCGRGILALGGLGVTARSGYAQLLLHCCLINNPVRYVEVMAPVLRQTGAYTKANEKSPSGVAFYDWLRDVVLSEKDLRMLVCAGSDGVKWRPDQKDLAQLWVSCCSELLRDEAMDTAQQSFAEEVMPALLTEDTKVALKWPQQGPRDFWQYTPEQQLLWGLACILALADEEETERLMLGAREMSDAREDFSAEGMLGQLSVKLMVGNFEQLFRDRFHAANTLLQKLMGMAPHRNLGSVP